jgi:nucleotide-binding universal stress UspA family protein
MKRILVPTDFSPTAELAFRFAVNVATRAKGTIILYHNYVPLGSTFIGTETTRKEYNTKYEARATKKMELLKNRVLGDVAEVAITIIVGRAPLMDNMLRFAAHNNIELIVMGTQGASGFKKTIIGSVAAKIAGKSDIPVLLVPEKYIMKDPKHFVFASNFQSSEKNALSLVIDMANMYDADLTVLHFQSLNLTASEKEKEKKDFETYTDALQSIYNESNIKFHLIEASSVIETMESMCEVFPYDIMVMVRRKKSFFEKFFIKSFTQNMAYTTQKPLLIFPASDDSQLQ